MSTLETKLSIPCLPQLNIQSLMDTLSDKKKQCQTLLKIMQQWRNIQHSYSKKMSQLAETLNKLSSQKKPQSKHSSSKQVFENLWYLMNIVSIQSKNLVLKIDDDMITEAKETIKKMTIDFSNPLQAEKTRKKSLLAKKKVIDQTYVTLMERKRGLEDITTNKFITEQCIDSSLEKRIKISKKILEEQVEFKLIEYKMKEIIIEYNSQLENYEKQSKQSIKSIKEIENCYSKVILDLYIKSQLHRGTEYKTILHEIDRISEKNIEYSVRDDEVEENLGCSKFEMDDFDSFLLRSVKMIDNKTIEELTVYSKDKSIKQTLRGSRVLEEEKPKQLQTRSRSESESSNPAKYYQNLSKFFIQCLQGQPTQSQLFQLNKLLSKDQKRRIDFVSIFQRYRTEGRCQMKSSKRRAKKILEMFLDIVVIGVQKLRTGSVAD